ncbi:MAG: YtoQ family protein [Planctomycetes bacterium]|nr:YtoQ family protein [Planctomycetota bacterium]
MTWKVYLSGEIHSDWRGEIASAVATQNLDVQLLAPQCDHQSSDEVGEKILGAEESAFWTDHKAVKINAIRVRKCIEDADVVVVRFGDQYKQWNAAYDAGYAVAKGKSLIVMHDPALTHALKEVDSMALAVVETPQQVVDILSYVHNNN